MLSYMVPTIEDKPLQLPNKNNLQLNLDNAGLPPIPPKLINGSANKKPLKSYKSTEESMIVTTSTSPSDTRSSIIRSSTDGGNKTLRTTTITTEGGNKGVKTSTVVLDSETKIIKNPLSTEGSSGPTVVATTHSSALTTERPKAKLMTNGGSKHQSLKRVSFGSSKGSMVETLIFESPLQEEPEGSPTTESPGTDSNTGSDCAKAASKVKVSFFEQVRPLVVNSPDSGDDLDAQFVLSMTSPSPVPDHAPPYNRQTSTDSGWDNPFRPDGDLSREADEIVELIKGGKPITPTPGSVAPKLPSVEDNSTVTPQTASPVSQSPVKGANGNTVLSNNKSQASPPGAVELQRATVVPPSDASHVQHVVLKKKPKCKCCVIQ
uniref:Uncharacterized protein n=1 Tax=Clastoptera arizonana TaxID=38151 RepID=A0A1B6CW58_9HEMI